jgi:diguanylate cyclase (GGDEF)-like protein
MRDMTLVSGMPSSGSANPANAMTAKSFNQELFVNKEEEMIIRARLIQALQTSLEPFDLLATFFKQIQSHVSVSGMTFTFNQETKSNKETKSNDDTKNSDNVDIKMGRECLHHVDYRLTTENIFLGELIFSRSKRFAESELMSLEFLLGALIYPLRNALRHQSALRLALIDPLTHLGNRTALDSTIRREIKIAERYKHDLSLILIDIDFFKQVNDEHGHLLGDLVLRKVAKEIQAVCRESDITFRYGGEEFVVVLGKTNLDDAYKIAERIREKIEKCKIQQDGKNIRVTVSIGISNANLSQPTKSLKNQVMDLLGRADKALYQAKESGRNKVVIEDSEIISS